MHQNICCCSSFVQCLWAAVQKNNISCCTLKRGVSAQGLVLFSCGCSEQASEKTKQSSHRGLKSHRNCLVKQGEYLDCEREMWWCWAREVFDYILLPACCRRGFALLSETSGLSRQPGLGLHFWGILPACWDILVQRFLPMDLLAGITLLRACARLCGCRAGVCLNPGGGCNQMRIRLHCLCISGATFLIKTISLLSLIKPLTGHTTQPHYWGAWWPLTPQFSHGGDSSPFTSAVVRSGARSQSIPAPFCLVSAGSWVIYPAFRWASRIAGLTHLSHWNGWFRQDA